MFARICAIDFEASSLSGWPIEVGISRMIGDTLMTWSSLIQPALDWTMDVWDPGAEAVHRIPRHALDHAPTPAEVAAELLRRIGDAIIVSDAPAYDGAWLRRLLTAAGRDDQLELHRFADIAADLLANDPFALDRVHERLARQPARHRAGGDAERLIRALTGHPIGGRRVESGEQDPFVEAFDHLRGTVADDVELGLGRDSSDG